MARLCFALLLCLLLIGGYLHRFLVNQIVLKGLEQILLCLVNGKLRYFFKHVHLALSDFFRFFKLIVRLLELLLDVFFLLVKGVELFVEGFLLLLNPSFLSGHLGAALLYFALSLCPVPVNLVLSLDKLFFFERLRFFSRLVYDSYRFLLGGAYLRFRNFLSMLNTKPEQYHAAYTGADCKGGYT